MEYDSGSHGQARWVAKVVSHCHRCHRYAEGTGDEKDIPWPGGTGLLHPQQRVPVQHQGRVPALHQATLRVGVRRTAVDVFGGTHLT